MHKIPFCCTLHGSVGKAFRHGKKQVSVGIKAKAQNHEAIAPVRWRVIRAENHYVIGSLFFPRFLTRTVLTTTVRKRPLQVRTGTYFTLWTLSLG